MEEKVSVQNRRKLNIVVVINRMHEPQGLAYVLHGLSGSKDQPHIAALSKAFNNAGYTTVRYDATNSMNESEGDLENATLTGHMEDFEDIIEWSKAQNFYQTPFIVSGHSLGAACGIMYASKNQSNVKALIPVSPFISGDIYEHSYDKETIKRWSDTGLLIEQSTSRPGLIKKQSWSLMEDLRKYNMNEYITKVNIPMLLLACERDERIPFNYQEELFANCASEQKELHIIREAPHTITDKKQLYDMQGAIINWLPTVA